MLLKAPKGLTSQIILAMLLGIIVGWSFGPKFGFLAEFGKLVIQLIKAAAVPLVFFAILEALIFNHIPLKRAGHLLLIILINAFFAGVIGLSLANYFEPGLALNLEQLKTSSGAVFTQGNVSKIDFGQVLSGIVPNSFFEPFINNNILSLVFVALLVGLAIKAVVFNPEQDAFSTLRQQLPQTFKFLITVFNQILFWLLRLVPLAVFCVISKTVGEFGFAPFKALALYVMTISLGLALQCCLVYVAWIWWSGIGVKKFFIEAKETLLYAFGTNSSLATLPVTLATLDRLGVSKTSSRLGACVGTNLNNDGILLYEAMALLFVLQAHGISLDFSTQIVALFLCLVSAMGVAGVPEAGIISLSLVLSTVGLPLEILPLLLTVDWLVARLRSVTNVMSDFTVSIVLDRFAQKKL